MVDHGIRQLLPEGRVPVLVHLLAGADGQCGRSVHEFGKRPVHAIGDNGLAVPIGRVGESHGAVGVPCVGHGTREQMLGGFDKCCCAPSRLARSSTPTA